MTTTEQLTNQMEAFLTELRALADKCIDGEWAPYTSGTKTVDEAVKFTEDVIRSRESSELFFVGVGEVDSTLCVALTGNGPHSEHHMRYIAAMQPKTLRGILNYTTMLYNLVALYGAVGETARNLTTDPNNQQEWALLRMGLDAVDQYINEVGEE